MAKKSYIGINDISRKIKKGYWGVAEIYTEVEYIESSGTQYINTGWKPTNMNFEIESQFRIMGTATDQTIFGAPQGTSEVGLILNLMVGTNLWQLGVNITWQNATHSSCAANKDLSVVVQGSSTGTTLTVNGELVTTNTQTTCSPADNVRLFSAYKTSANNLYPATARMYSFRVRDNGILVRDFVPCTDASGTADLYDLANNKFYTNAGSGSFTVGATTGITYTSKSVARKIKKAYIGINNLARPFWGAGTLAYYGTITSLSNVRYNMAGTSVGNYGLFGGGYGLDGNVMGYVNIVDAYDTSLTRSSPTRFNTARVGMKATSNGNYAIFAGGNSDYISVTNVVDAYNTSLTRSAPTGLSASRSSLAATSVGDYALFGGGTNGTGTSWYSTVDAYNKSLTRSTPTGLSAGRDAPGAASVGNYALFVGGSNLTESGMTTVDAYNLSLTRSTPTALSSTRSVAEGVSKGNYAIFAGGVRGSGSSRKTLAVVDAYDTSLTRSTPTALSVARSSATGTAVGDYALFGPGANSSAIVEAYDASLTRSTLTGLSTGRTFPGVTTVGDYALFGGGFDGTQPKGQQEIDIVDAYTLA